MRILITGGAGFVASHLTSVLLDNTPGAITLLDNFNAYYDSTWKRKNARLFAAEPRVKLVEGDFSSPEFCHRLFAESGFSHVVHLGAYPGVPLSLKEPLTYAQHNFSGTTALLEAARAFPVERFLFASSSTVYGLGTPAPFVEDAPLGVPASPYGATKRAAEIMGLTFHKLFGVPFTSLRLFNVYGPRLRPDLALTIFTRKILGGEPLPIYGDGSIRRDFTHVTDICAGILAAFTAADIAGECLNLGHNEPITVMHLIELIASAAQVKPKLEFRPPREGDMPLTCADLTKSARLLGYQPRVDIEHGVNDYVAWYKRQLQDSGVERWA